MQTGAPWYDPVGLNALERKPAAELADIQRLIVSGFGQLPKAMYILFRITDAAAARAWLAAQIAHVGLASTTEDSSRFQLAIAFTHEGLERLGLHPEVLRSFIPEFRQGMTAPHRARVLGDANTADWRWGNAGQPVHLLCAAYARDLPKLGPWSDPARAGSAPPGLSHVTHVEGDAAETEPFGFKDNISQPYIKGTGKGGKRFAARDRVRAGEFILGYKNEFGVLPASPAVPAALGIGPLATVPLSSDGDLGRNGSFLVVRELEQNIDAFRLVPEHVAACMVGRWKDGRPLVAYPPRVPLSSTAPRRAPDALGMADDNDFTYYSKDAAGLRCPLGAHIRRANPRDALADPRLGITPEQALKLANQHRILRRGRNFERHGKKGLFFMCLNTNIERQFEFVQQTWINNPKFSGPRDELDPLTAPASSGAITFTMRGGPERERAELSSFVTARGGAYFFLPSLRALQYLAELQS